jgi:hypothetical protein
MLQRLHDYERLTLRATDGELGHVNDFLFDDEQWTIRYLVARTGSVFGRKVAISPISIVQPDWVEAQLSARLTRNQIRNSPDLLAAQPIPRSAEQEHALYYGYPAHWGGPSLWGWAGSPGALAGSAPVDYTVSGVTDLTASRLHSAADLRGAHLLTNDAEIGHVDDLVIDDERWNVRYLLTDTSNWIGGQHVLVPTDRVATVDWLARHVHLELLTEQVRNAPRYDPDRPLDRTMEEALRMYYDPPHAASQGPVRGLGVQR